MKTKVCLYVLLFLLVCGYSADKRSVEIKSIQPPLSVKTQVNNNISNQTDNQGLDQNNNGFSKNAKNPLKIDTYDGSGQAMHPKVLF